MKKNPPKPIKWEMTEEEDEAMINQAMMLQVHNSNRKAGELTKKDIEKAGEMEEGTQPLADSFEVDEDMLHRLEKLEEEAEQDSTKRITEEESPLSQEEERKARLRKEGEEWTERMAKRLMEEEGLTREQAEAKLNWPL
jgi:hypothetical protein